MTAADDGAAPAAGDGTPAGGPARATCRTWTPWRAVVGFGVVSLAADVVYEGARSITGPLATLGASALLVGLVTGVGEALALLLRLPFGTRVDRTGAYWSTTLGGYVLTAVCVPLLAVTPFLGAAGLAVACGLVLTERIGKAVRSPAKSTLLSHVAGDVGMGRGFGVHKALDQVGSFSGPLLVAGVVALTGAVWPAFALLAVPGVLAVVLLVGLRRRIGDPPSPGATTAPTDGATTTPTDGATTTPTGGETARRTGAPAVSLLRASRDLPTRFWWFAAAAALTSAGLPTFGVLGYHLVTDDLVPAAGVPLVYAGAMVAGAVAALVVGWVHDRTRGRVLLVMPPLVVLVPALGFAGSLAVVVVGAVVWGAATGLQDSTVKALVAELVPVRRRATAYGVFAAVQGSAAALGGVLAGALYERSVPLLVGLVAVLQAVAFALLLRTLRRDVVAEGTTVAR